MGQAVPILGAIGHLDCCGTWAKYVCNAGKCHSRCGQCCDLELETEMVVPSDEEEDTLEVQMDGCCSARMA